MGEWRSTLEGLVSLPTRKFWEGKRVLLTGHTGFKGAWMTLLLKHLGAEVIGVALPPETSPSLFVALDIKSEIEHHELDIATGLQALFAVFESTRPDVVIHMAAQALVRRSYREPVESFSTNVMGTVNLLEAARAISGLHAILVVTTDKVYRNREDGRAFVEADPLGGHDPYSASKAACEMAVESYAKSYFLESGVAVISARAGNVIGGGDWSDDRLVPDVVGAWLRSETLEIRNPAAVRPWQHVLEPLVGYLLAIESASGGEFSAYNFGPRNKSIATVKEVLGMCETELKGLRLKSVSVPSQWHEAGLLKLDSRLAARRCGFQPVWDVEEAVTKTLHWYRELQAGASARVLCEYDMSQYGLCMS